MPHTSIPLATRMRPATLDDFFGQEQLLGEASGLLQSINSGAAPSIILWGPPGTGKTTLANIIANKAEAKFATLSAVTDGVKELRKVIADVCKRKPRHS